MKILIKADVDLTLMILNSSGDYMKTNISSYPYYIILPEELSTDLNAISKEIMIAIYNQHYHRFKESEPNDPNYINVVAVKPHIITENSYKDKPWLHRKMPMWESSNLIKLEGNQFFKLNSDAFELALLEMNS